MTKNVLITGGTGFLGKAILARLAELPEYGRIYLLVRAKGGKSAQERVDEIVESMFPSRRTRELKARIRAVDGDLVLPRLGLDEAGVGVLSSEMHQILHVGASTDFGAPLAESRLYNVEGTRAVLDLALELSTKGRLERFDYVSTAYVAGRKAGRVTEKDLNRGQEFSNSYEQSKYEAEVLVRQHMGRLKIAIYRPSIVVGDSKSGYTPHFKVLYWPLRLLSRDLLPFFPTNPRAHLDVVPVDFVADGIVALMTRPESLGETFHLTAGMGREIRIAQFLRDAYALAYIKPRPIVPFWLFNLIRSTVAARLFPPAFWDAIDLAKPYTHYLKGTGVRFDARRTHEILARLGIRAPTWDDYKREVLTYCRASRWGRKRPLPEYVYYLPVSSRKDVIRDDADAKRANAYAPLPVGQNA